MNEEEEEEEEKKGIPFVKRILKESHFELFFQTKATRRKVIGRLLT